MSFTFELILPFPSSAVSYVLIAINARRANKDLYPGPKLREAPDLRGTRPWSVEEIMLCVEETGKTQYTQALGFGEIWRRLSFVGLEALEAWRPRCFGKSVHSTEI